jgi:hypothetical protein
MGFLGIFAGMTYGTMRSTQRLLGLEPNASEVKKYGALTAEQISEQLAFIDAPHKNLIDASQSH